MNEPGFENSMFTDEKSYEINIHAWVCIQNTITGYKRVPQLIRYPDNSPPGQLAPDD